MAKTQFEEQLWELAYAEIKHIHSDTGVFATDVFQADFSEKHQPQSLQEFMLFTKMPMLSMQSRQLYTWQGPLWCMFHVIGLNMVLKICHYDHLLWNM